MRDTEFPPDPGTSHLNLHDPEVRTQCTQTFRVRYRRELRGLELDSMDHEIRELLDSCLKLEITSQKDVLRFLAFMIFMPPAQKASQFLQKVVTRILNAKEDWSATKRLDFLYKKIVGRPAPVPEPDFGPW